MVLPGTSVWATARSIAARSVAAIGRAVAPAFGLSSSSGTPNIAATTAAALATDTDLDGKADANDVIRYTTKIDNTGSDATGVHFSSAPPAGTTWDGTYIVIADDSYTSTVNMTLDTSTLLDCANNFRVTCNDVAASATVSAFGNSQASAGGTPANPSGGTTTVTT